MKALTICQPYCELILRGEKRVENRTWPTRHRGLMYIHAGKNRSWLTDNDLERFPHMPFGAVVGIVNIVDCITLESIESGAHDKTFPWLRSHEHANGPWCWIINDKVTPIGPWSYRGKQGLFEIEDAALDAIANKSLASK